MYLQVDWTSVLEQRPYIAAYSARVHGEAEQPEDGPPALPKPLTQLEADVLCLWRQLRNSLLWLISYLGLGWIFFAERS
jgi:hypothetical protein